MGFTVPHHLRCGGGAGSGIATRGAAPDTAERQRAELACPQGWGCSAAAHPAREVRLCPDLLTPKIGRGSVPRAASAA